MTTISRTIIDAIPARETSDGAGVRLKRSIGTAGLDHLDPFLLLDEFGSEAGADYIGGFPDHPHRGFETVTYMLDGRMRHEDSRGNAGLLTSGGVQWMTAGRGIVHSEMPEQSEGLMRGFQLWVNLPAADKMTEPRYQNLEPGDIPEITPADGVRVRIIAGACGGRQGAVHGIAADPLYLDVELAAGRSFEQPLAASHRGFVYPFEGAVSVAATALPTSTLGVLGDGDAVTLTGGPSGGRAILVAARPLGEPVARSGPFVMNTREELMQAYEDFRAGRF